MLRPLRRLHTDDIPGWAGEAREIEITDTPPYWQYTGISPDNEQRSDDQRDLGIIPIPYPWLIWYPADYLPENSSPAWAKHMTGIVTHSVADSILTVQGTDSTNYIYWQIPASGLNNSDGTFLDCRVRVPTDSSDLNQGFALSIHDGTYQFSVYFRTDGFNIAGCAHVPLNMTYWRRVTLLAQYQYVKVFIDNHLQQTGAFANTAADKIIQFGSCVTPVSSSSSSSSSSCSSSSSFSSSSSSFSSSSSSSSFSSSSSSTSE